MNKPIDSFQGRPIVSQRAGRTITRVGAPLGAEITGVDLCKPISEGSSPARFTAISDEAPKSIRAISFAPKRWRQVWKRPPLPNASPEPRN